MQRHLLEARYESTSLRDTSSIFVVLADPRGLHMATATEQSFHHEALKEGHVRLLHTKSVSEGLVDCSLSHVPLEGLSHYECLSYCWGNGLPDHSIRIDGRAYSVTSNLLTAIKTRHRCLQGSDVPIWIDAICIDQSNNEEKSVQVRLMGDIYSQAAAVLVWLGEASKGIRMFADTVLWLEYAKRKDQPEKFQLVQQSRIDEVSEIVATGAQTLEARYGLTKLNLEALRDLHSGLSLMMERATRALGTPERNLPSWSGPFWDSLLEYVTRPWFTRLWTWQEIRLARTALVFCGDIVLDWTILKPFFFLIFDFRYSRLLLFSSGRVIRFDFSHNAQAMGCMITVADFNNDKSL